MSDLDTLARPGADLSRPYVDTFDPLVLPDGFDLSDPGRPPGGPVPSADPVRPPEAAGWRERLAPVAAALDMPLPRLLGGAALLAVLAVLAWRMLAPPPAPAEMALPTADRSTLASHVSPAGDAAAAQPSPAGPSGAASGAAPPPPPMAASGGAGRVGGDVGEVVVHVVGDVVRPGVQHLHAGARVQDAVAAAGGSRPDADLTRLNLAALLQDGEQVYVLKVGEIPPAPVAPAVAGGPGGTGPGGGIGVPAAPVDLNTATADQLDALPGIGPATAAAIIDLRQQRGGFRSVDDLLDVRGIGDAKLAQLRPHVTV